MRVANSHLVFIIDWEVGLSENVHRLLLLVSLPYLVCLHRGASGKSLTIRRCLSHAIQNCRRNSRSTYPSSCPPSAVSDHVQFVCTIPNSIHTYSLKCTSLKHSCMYVCLCNCQPLIWLLELVTYLHSPHISESSPPLPSPPPSSSLSPPLPPPLPSPHVETAGLLDGRKYAGVCALIVLHYHIYNASDRKLARAVWDLHKTVSFSTELAS